MKDEIHPLLEELTDDQRRVKVAILDTGIDLEHVDMVAREERIKDVRSWANGKDGLQDFKAGDLCGHGTFAAGLLLDVAPHIDVYVAQITETDKLEDISHIAKVTFSYLCF